MLSIVLRCSGLICLIAVFGGSVELAAGTIAPPKFAPAVSIPTASGQTGIAVGDLDVDGKPDIVAANYFNNSISVFRNIALSNSITSNSFSAPVKFTVSNTPVIVRIADIDGDGRPEILVVNAASSTISVFHNTSTTGELSASSFEPPVYFATPSDPRYVSAADLDGDGRKDLIVATFGSSKVSIFRNTSITGVINSVSFAARVDLNHGTSSVSVEAADIDGDGKKDLVVGNVNESTISLYRNVSTLGSLTTNSFPERINFATGAGPTVAIGDLDGDGRPDIATANQFNATISVLRNTASPGQIDSTSLAPKVDFAAGNYPYAIVLADFIGGDNKLDIAVANADSHTISVYRNVSIPGGFTNGSLLPKSDFLTLTGPRFVEAADIDSDGLIDVINADLSTSSFSVHRNIAGARILSFPYRIGPVFRFRMDALPDSPFVVQISTNLVDWKDEVTTTTNFLGSAWIVDSNAIAPHAFYRLRNP